MRTKQTKQPKPKTKAQTANSKRPKAAPTKSENRVTGKQIKNKRFAQEFVASGGNGVKAVTKAGSQAKNKKVIASQLLADPEVQAEIKQVAEAARTAAVLTAQQVLERLSEQATFDPTPYLKSDGTMDLEKIKGDKVGHLFQTWSVSFGSCRAIPYSHQKALMQLAKCLGMEMAPKANEFEAVRNGVRAYMEVNQCTLEEALQKLPARFPVVSRYASQLLEQGVLPL